MGAGTFVFDADYIFEGEEVFDKLEELDEQKKRDDSAWECTSCHSVLQSEDLEPDTAQCPQCGTVGAFRRRIQPGLLMRIGYYLRAFDHVTMVIENDVVDEEYFREFLYFYATTFWEHPPTARRLHFFAKPWADLAEKLDPQVRVVEPAEELDLGYLGYVVLRPTVPQTVGETLLALPPKLDAETCYVTCATTFGQTVAGRRLRIQAAPFIGQDQTGVCAHSALWGALKYLHKYRYYEKMSMPDLAVRAAKLYPGTRFTRPSSGLKPEAIYAVLRDLGFNVHYEPCRPTGDVPEPRNPVETIYLAVESGLPALLHLEVYQGGVALGGHAVWICGHTLGPLGDEGCKRQAGEAIFETLRTPVARLFVNDDNIGPYLPATVERAIQPGSPPVKFCNLRYDPYPTEPYSDPMLFDDVVRLIAGVFVPLPEEVFVLPYEALEMVDRILSADYLGGLAEVILKRNSRASEARAAADALLSFEQRLANGEVLLRPYLCMADRYREHVVRGTMLDQVRALYTAGFAFPEYIWVMEIVDKATAGEGDPGEAVIGEILLDSTDSLALTLEEAPRYLALHIPGLLAYSAAIEVPVDLKPTEAGALLWALLPAEQPYRCFPGHTDAADAPRSHRKLGPIVENP